MSIITDKQALTVEDNSNGANAKVSSPADGSRSKNIKQGEPSTRQHSQSTGHQENGRTKSIKPKGLKLQRLFTTQNVNPFDTLEWEKRDCKITNPDGTVVFEMKDIEVPKSWSRLATDIAISKYFRRQGIPDTGHEVSIRQLIYRVAHTIRQSGEEQGGYFSSKEDADIFENELTHMLVHQIGAFNSPVWFNCGLAQTYGISGRPSGNFYWSKKSSQVEETADSYTYPQVSACFIQSVKDDLMDIADLVKREMKIFKFGSGTGSNFSRVRAEGEPLSEHLQGLCRSSRF